MSDKRHTSVGAGDAVNVDAQPVGLADRLWQATRRLHTEAEKTGFVGDVLRQRATRAGYTLFLRNLLPAYEALEAGLSRHADGKGALHALARSEIFRAQAIRVDLGVLHGPAWERDVPLLDSGAAYAARIGESGVRSAGLPLTGHAYTRYLGDLNGGQVLARLLARGLGLPEAGLTFYDFRDIPAPLAFATVYRQAIDGVGEMPGADVDEILHEARASFQSSIVLSHEVAAVVSAQ